jgi:hypothetical protein
MAISPHHVARLAEVLGVALDDLLGSKPAPVRPDIPAGRTYDAFVRMGKLPQQEQKRLLDAVEDLISAAEQRQKR